MIKFLKKFFSSKKDVDLNNSKSETIIATPILNRGEIVAKIIEKINLNEKI